MRKLILQTQVSVDGFMAGTNGEMDWMQWNWDEDLKKFVNQLTEPVDCILLGRVLAQGFIDAWANNPKTEDAWFVDKMNNTPKIVFSRTLSSANWKNTTLAKGDLAEEIARLKALPGNDMIAYGGSSFVSNLIKHDLIDELNLFVNPTAIGQGMSVFKEKSDLQLIKATPFSCGIVVLTYRPK